MCVETLRGGGVEMELYWYNPNIHPFTEYRSRRDCAVQYAKSLGITLITKDHYGLRDFIASLEKTESGRFDVPGRCAFCYRLRLEQTARAAKERGFDAFSTSLLVSPYQNHEVIKTTGYEAAQRYGVDFFYRDWRPFFREGQRKARAAGCYMQKYCGCIFSEEERFGGVT
jgi:predicted adenine nucleotide alpha hydrolase (AANH) superfamily ATPase